MPPRPQRPHRRPLAGKPRARTLDRLKVQVQELIDLVIELMVPARSKRELQRADVATSAVIRQARREPH
ncbi:hypothetical protein [Amycolatopsis sp. NPDC003731]